MKQFLRYFLFLSSLTAGFRALPSWAQQGCGPSLNTGIQAWLPLDESTGIGTIDASGQGYKGELSATAASWQPNGGVNRGALALQAGGYVQMPLYWQPTAFTVSWWVNPSQFDNYSQAVSALSPNYGGGWGGFAFHSDVNGTIYVGTNANSRIVVGAGANTLVLNTWQHFTFTYTPTSNTIGIGRLYRNGQSVASKSDMAAPQAWNGLCAGAAAATSFSFLGLLDDLRVYKRALSDLEVQQLNQCRALPPVLSLCPPLRITASGDATIVAGGSTPLKATPSLAGNMLTFDGVDDNLQVATRDGDPRMMAKTYATTVNNFTMEAWVLPTVPHKIDPEMTQYGGLSGGQRWAFPGLHGGLYYGNDDHATVALSVGTNGVSVYEWGAGYLPAVLVWQAPIDKPLTGWTHVAVVYSNRQPSLYINGVLVRKTTVNVAGVTRSLVHPTSNLGGGTYRGSIDEVRVWNIARPEADIIQTKNNVFAYIPGSLIGYWRLDEGQGQVARDLTPADNDGHLKGGSGLPGPNSTGPNWASSTAPLTGTDTTPPVSLSWSPTPGLSAVTGTDVTAAPATTTAYVVQATTSCRTTAQARVTVTVTPGALAPVVNLPVACTPTIGGTAPSSRGSATDVVNYVRTYAARQAFTDPTTLVAAGPAGVQVKTEYLDGLGQPVQTVLRQESPLGRDLVQPSAYDALGRQPRAYLPYVSGSTSAGDYRPDALKEQDNFYRATNMMGPGLASDNTVRTGFAYTEQQFEASPLNRVMAQTAPGENWNTHPAAFTERSNTADDNIARLSVGYAAAGNPLTYQGAYAAGELWLKEAQDEDQRLVRTFIDKQGQVVAKLVQAPSAPATQWLTTYYAYDDFARLRAVIPPKAVALLLANGVNLTDPGVTRLLFRYRYDGRGRQIAKQLPSQDGEQVVVYDQLDRPLLTQDAQQRTRQEWSWIKYDALWRPVLTGLVTRNATADQLQQEADQLSAAATTQQFEQRTTTAPHYYSTTQAYPRLDQDGFAGNQVLTVTYYDDYDFDNTGAQVDKPYYSGGNRYLTSPPQPNFRVTGLVTSAKTRVLGVAAGTVGEWLTTTTFYDDRGRTVQQQSTNARGGNDIRTSQLDFAGKVEKTHSIHTAPNTNITGVQVVETYSYDAAGRVLEVRQQVDNEATATLVASNTYNELGQLVRKTLSPNSALQQQVDYTYNPRGWLQGLNEDLVTGATPVGTSTDLWGLRLSYDCGFQVPQYNGNISGQQWRSKADGIARAYGYSYDRTNRLTRGDYVAQAEGGSWRNEQQNYAVGMRYDENGNIQRLVRNGLLVAATHKLAPQFGRVDQLAYTYQGNRLIAVDDTITGNGLARSADYHGAATSLAGDFLEKTSYRSTGQVEYGYDANGSLLNDANKGITQIRYNFLNLPELVKFTDQDYLEFRYAANGQKVAKRVFQAGKPMVQTDYLNGYQYESDSLRFFGHAEGRVLRFVSPTSGQVRYEREYTLKDHLGNLRLAYRRGLPIAYTATLETTPAERATQEEQQWDQQSLVSTRTQVNAQARTGSYVARLNAAAGKPIGPLKLLSVQKGDTVTITAPGYYPQRVSSGSSYAFSLLSYVAQLVKAGPAPAPAGDLNKPLKPLPFLNVSLAVVPALPPVGGGVPKGYVRLLAFNQDSVLISSQTRQLSTLASTGYEELKLSLIAPAAGYMEAYVGNESEVDVYFDDVTLDYHPGLRIQENQYDPWGINLAGLDFTTLDSNLLNKYQFNSKEQQNDLGLNWTDYGARMYDPQLGKWHSVDPLAEISRKFSVYSYVLDNPIRFIDPDGMTWKNPRDKEIANNLQSGISQRLASQDEKVQSLTNKITRLEGKLAKAKDDNSASLKERISEAKADKASAEATMSDLHASSDELSEMETTTSQIFTFNELPGDSQEGETRMDGGVITMDITSGDAGSNVIHEAAHGYQKFKGVSFKDRASREVGPYQRQLSFSQSNPNKPSGYNFNSFVPSIEGSISNRSDITPAWVTGLHVGDRYPYLGAFGITLTLDMAKEALRIYKDKK
jgi:RHS repeat-associated protein